MGTEGCRELIELYTDWLKKKISVQDKDGVCEITTPFLDRHNDYVQIYVKKSGTNITISDDGYILSDLKLSGLDINTEKRKQILTSISNGFGVTIQDGEIHILATTDDFPQKKHNLIQSMLAINDMFMTTKKTAGSIFKEDVEKFLSLYEIRNTPSVKFTGKSKFDHYFDYVIPASKIQTERVIKVVSRPNRPSIMNFIFAWADTKDARPIKSIVYPILNDIEPMDPGVETALKEYGIKPILWSKKEEYLEELRT
ncbi:MAG TPA: DUF1828 domain-containing protein [Candidatus Methanoperedens sp.]